MNNLQAIVIAAASCSCFIAGCKDEMASSSAMVHQQVEGGAEPSDKPAAQEPLQEFRGILSRGTAGKSYEAWNATTHEYYVLDIPYSDPAHPVRRLMLRDTEQVPLEILKSFAGKHVVVKARYVEHPVVYREDSVEQVPLFPVPDANGMPKLDSNGEMRLEPPSTKQGYAVESITEDSSR